MSARTVGIARDGASAPTGRCTPAPSASAGSVMVSVLSWWSNSTSSPATATSACGRAPSSSTAIGSATSIIHESGRVRRAAWCGANCAIVRTAREARRDDQRFGGGGSRARAGDSAPSATKGTSSAVTLITSGSRLLRGTVPEARNRRGGRTAGAAGRAARLPATVRASRKRRGATSPRGHARRCSPPAPGSPSRTRAPRAPGRRAVRAKRGPARRRWRGMNVTSRKHIPPTPIHKGAVAGGGE